MPFTSRLGQSDSRLGQFQLSQLPSGGSGVFEEGAQNNLVLQTDVTAFTLTPDVEDVLALVSDATSVNFAVQNPSNALALISSATQAGPINRSASSTLALTDEAVAPGYVQTDNELILESIASLDDGVPIYQNASNTLALSQQALEGFVPLQQVTSTLELAGVLSDSGIPQSASAASTLVVTDLAYSNIKNLDASNTLELVEEAYAGQPVDAEAENILALLDEARPGIIVESLSSPLALVQEALGDTTISNRSVTDTVTLVQALTSTIDHQVTVVSTLTLTDLAVKNQLDIAVSHTLSLLQFAGVPTSVSLADTLALQQTVRVSPIDVSAETELGLTDSHNVAHPHYVDTQNYLTIIDPETTTGDPDSGDPIDGTITGLQHSVDFHQSIANVSVVSLISFSQQMGQIKQVFADNALELVDSAEEAKGYVEETLELVQTLDGQVSKPGSNDLEITDAADFQVDRALTPSDTISLVQAAAAAIDDDQNICNYAPFGDLPAAPSLGEGVLTLTYPFAAPTSTVVLRNPEFNNSERLELTRISRTSRGGTFIVFADTNWPKVKVLTMKVVALSDVQRVDLLNFIETSIGKEIGLLDHENRQWRGILLNPNTPVTHQHNCNHEVDLEFEGELV